LGAARIALRRVSVSAEIGPLAVSAQDSSLARGFADSARVRAGPALGLERPQTVMVAQPLARHLAWRQAL